MLEMFLKVSEALSSQVRSLQYKSDSTCVLSRNMAAQIAKNQSKFVSSIVCFLNVHVLESRLEAF